MNSIFSLAAWLATKHPWKVVAAWALIMAAAAPFATQFEHTLSGAGWDVAGSDSQHARQLIEDALALQDAGAFAVVLELIPAPLAREITQRLQIPTIGIGAGVNCSGEVQVWHDILGLYTDRQPRHTRRYLNLAEQIEGALGQYAADVRAGAFPTAANSSTMDAAELEEALRAFDSRRLASPKAAQEVTVGR